MSIKSNSLTEDKQLKTQSVNKRLFSKIWNIRQNTYKQCAFYFTLICFQAFCPVIFRRSKFLNLRIYSFQRGKKPQKTTWHVPAVKSFLWLFPHMKLVCFIKAPVCRTVYLLCVSSVTLQIIIFQNNRTICVQKPKNSDFFSTAVFK